MTRPSRLVFLFAVALAVCVASCAARPAVAPDAAWTVVRFEKSEVAVPTGWSMRLWRGGGASSPWMLWFMPDPTGIKPMLVNSWPGQKVSPVQMKQDLGSLLQQMGAPDGATEFQVLHPRGREVHCVIRRAEAVYVACIASAEGRVSASVLLWMGVAEYQLQAAGGVGMLAAVTARVDDLPYVERRYE
jgi:hypothetical protein